MMMMIGLDHVFMEGRHAYQTVREILWEDAGYLMSMSNQLDDEVLGRLGIVKTNQDTISINTITDNDILILENLGKIYGNSSDLDIIDDSDNGTMLSKYKALVEYTTTLINDQRINDTSNELIDSQLNRELENLDN